MILIHYSLNNNFYKKQYKYHILNKSSLLFISLLSLTNSIILLLFNFLYFLLFLVLTIPFFAFIFIDMTFFHLTGFMLKMIVFPFDDFTSLCDRQKIFIKIFISISFVSKKIFICKLMFLLQFLFYIFYLLYDTYIVFYKSYYLMNNELISKTKYSHLISIIVIQIFMLIMKPQEIFKKSFIIIIAFIIIFTSIFTFLFYNPYNYIIIDTPENRENAFYYFFLVDRNKNVTYFLEEKIKEHITKCDCCKLCYEYKKLKSNNVIEFIKDNDINNNDDLFSILYDGKDKSIHLFNHITKNIKKLGINCLYTNNSFYIINLIYIFYYSSKMGDFTFSLNQLLLFNLIQENNKALIINHKLSIKQITSINEFFILYKKIISKIQDILSKSNFKSYINKFFELSKQLTLLNSSKFKENLYATKNEGITNSSYLLSICSLLYEEIFNTTLSSYSIPIRENAQLHEDILKQFFKQNNNITLDFNLKTIECKIINAGKDLFYYANSNFYDLFPNQIKEKLIQNFSDFILNSKENRNVKLGNKNISKNKKVYIEPTLLIKIHIDNVKYYRLLNLKLALLFNDFLDKNILLNGFFHIKENILITINNNNGKKEKIFGYGKKDIMDVVYKYKFSFNNFKESAFMKNKIIQFENSISVNDTILYIYSIHELKKKKKKLENKETTSKLLNINDNYTLNNKESSFNDQNYDKNMSNIIGSENLEVKDNEENTNNNNSSSNNNGIQNINNLIEETASQSSVATKSSANSFWNLNKAMSKEDQSGFTSKKFLNLQLLLGGLLISLLILMIVLIIQLKILQVTISDYYNNYFVLHQFVRTFQQFSYGLVAVVCIVKDEFGNCEEYLSKLDTKDFNQTLFLNEQNNILAEFCSDSISKLILNSESIHDDILIQLFKGNISYYIVNIKKIGKIYNISYSIIQTTFSDALLLLSNNMRIIISSESRLKDRSKEPIYLISGLDNPFNNIQNKKAEISDFQIGVYTYLINYKLFVVRFSDLSSRLNELINIKNQRIISIINIFHNIIFVVMIFQIITILFYLLTYNKILAQIINSIILKFDIILDEENDFKKLFSTKINQLESIVSEYSSNPISPMNEINKNYTKFKNLITKKKKNEQRLNNNKKPIEEENKKILFKDRQKYINWKEIYQKGYDRFYIIFTIIIAITDATIYGVIFGIWIDYSYKSKNTLELIYSSWNFERSTLRIVNFYNTMIFNNQTLDEISDDYFSFNQYSAIENIHQILYSYYELRKKRQNIADIYKGFTYFCEYNCISLYNVMETIETNSFSETFKKLKNKYNLDPEQLKVGFVKECEESKPFIGNSVSPAFQNLYQKITDAMILFNNRTYEAIINKIFNSTFPQLSSVFLNVINYIIYIVGKVTYTNASNTIIDILGNSIVITLILYILAEISLFIFFFFVYIWNMNTECKNMFKLKSVFEITNLIES